MTSAEDIGEMIKFVGWQDHLLLGVLVFVGLILVIVALGGKKKK